MSRATRATWPRTGPPGPPRDTGWLRCGPSTCSPTPRTSSAWRSWSAMADRPVRGFGVAAGLDPDIGAEVARRCATHGYASLWSNDHPMASGLETAAVFAAAAPEPDVGVAVLALDRHSPQDVAAKIAEVGIEPSRLWVGIGAGFTKTPLGTVREGLVAMRAALPDGTRVAVAAMGPKMCRLAGAEADGVFLNWMTPDRAAWARERIYEGVGESERAEPPVVF